MSTKERISVHKDNANNGTLGQAISTVVCMKDSESQDVNSNVGSNENSSEQSIAFFSPPELDDEELALLGKKAEQKAALDKEWLKKAGKSVFECRIHLEKTEQFKEKFVESRARSKKCIDHIRKEARQRGINWGRVEDSVFIARINACPIPDTDKPETTKRAISEMERIVIYLTKHSHHRKESNGNPEVPLYHFANWDDKTKIDQYIGEHKDLPVGYRFYAGRWMVPNPDPVTGKKTAYQKAVEIAFGRLLRKYDIAVKATYRKEVEKLVCGKTEDPTGILDEVPNENYLIESPNGLGAILVRGFYKEFQNKYKPEEDGREVFVISVVEAVGIFGTLERIKGFYIPIWCAKKGFSPKSVSKEKKIHVERFAKIMKRSLEAVQTT